MKYGFVSVFHLPTRLRGMKLNVARIVGLLVNSFGSQWPTGPGASRNCKFSFWFSYHKEHFLAVQPVVL